MKFLDEVGLSESNIKKIRGNWGDADKEGKKNFVSGVFRWFIIFIPSYLINISLVQIQKCLRKWLSTKSQISKEFKRRISEVFNYTIKNTISALTIHEEIREHSNI